MSTHGLSRPGRPAELDMAHRRPRWCDVINVGRAAHGDWVIVTVSGELDLAAVPQLRDVLDPDTFPGRRRYLAVDLGGVTFCDCSALGVLVRTYSTLRDRNGQLVLLNTPAHIARQLEITGVDGILPTRSTLELGRGLAN